MDFVQTKGVFVLRTNNPGFKPTPPVAKFRSPDKKTAWIGIAGVHSNKVWPNAQVHFAVASKCRPAPC